MRLENGNQGSAVLFCWLPAKAMRTCSTKLSHCWSRNPIRFSMARRGITSRVF